MFNLLQTIIILLINHQVHALSQTMDLNPIIEKKLQAIEQKHHLKLGIYAIDSNNRHVISYNANEGFPFQSSSKFIAVSALLGKPKAVLNKTVVISPDALLPWHPISGQYLNKKVALKRLAEAAISYSDNTAINMIIHELGGLQAINRFAHRIGNSSFNISHYEINLNSDPQKNEDSSTPKDMAMSVEKIMLGSVLSQQNKALLLEWMRNNTTGYHRIRAGVPLGWSVADKTGSGQYGIANDIGIVWSPACKPLVLSIFSKSNHAYAKPNDDAIAEVTQTIVQAFEPHHHCYKETQLD